MLVQLTMFPTDKRGASVSSDVARVIDIIDRSGLPYKLNAMSTVIEGDWTAVMKLVNRCRLMLRRNHDRIYINMTIDDRGKSGKKLTAKTASIEQKLGREVNK